MGAWRGQNLAFYTIGGGPVSFNYVHFDTTPNIQEAAGVDSSYVEVVNSGPFNVELYLDYEVTGDGDIVVEVWLHDGSPSVIFTETIPGVTAVTDDYTYTFSQTIGTGYLQVVLASSSTATGDVNANGIFTIIDGTAPATTGHVGYVGRRS